MDYSADPAHAAELLAKIAELIGVPLEAFRDAGHCERGPETIELLRAWSAVRDGPARRRILNATLRAAGSGVPSALKPESSPVQVGPGSN